MIISITKRTYKVGGTIEMRIAICDDDSFYRECIQNIVATSLSNIGRQHTIKVFQYGEEFCQDENNFYEFDIVFLDIEMNKLNGMEVARKIRERNSEVAIVFITVAAEYVFEGYEVNAARYIMKQNFDKLLPECLYAIMNQKEKIKGNIRCKFINGYQEIGFHDLMYIESSLHKLCFVLVDKKLYQYEKLDEIEKLCREWKLIRSHKSFLVNPEYIVQINSYTIYLKDGTEIPIAKSRYAKAKEQFLKYKSVE